MRPSLSHLSLPWFEPAHKTLAQDLVDWASAQQVDERNTNQACREWVRRLGEAGWLRYCVAAEHGGALARIDSRALVIAREILAFYSPLADFAFAMQGLGSGAISLGAEAGLQQRYLPQVAQGRLIAAFALSEPDAGSDVAAMQTQASRNSNGDYHIDGLKTWISNGGIADFYCVFAKTQATQGAAGISAFVVDANSAGLDASAAIEVISPHPLAKITFKGVRVPAQARLGEEGAGFKLAMQTLDIFRASVAAAALGFARRALAQALAHARARKMFGQTLGDFQLSQAKLGEMAALIDSGAQLCYRAAWLRDVAGAGDPQGWKQRSVASAMAKMCATENAQRVIDMALQMHGGEGVRVGAVVEGLYRDIRALRIYEGATEVQQLIIGKALLKDSL